MVSPSNTKFPNLSSDFGSSITAVRLASPTKTKKELTTCVERTRSERGVALIGGGEGGGGGVKTTRLRAWARKDSSFTQY